MLKRACRDFCFTDTGLRSTEVFTHRTRVTSSASLGLLTFIIMFTKAHHRTVQLPRVSILCRHIHKVFKWERFWFFLGMSPFRISAWTPSILAVSSRFSSVRRVYSSFTIDYNRDVTSGYICNRYLDIYNRSCSVVICLCSLDSYLREDGLNSGT